MTFKTSPVWFITGCSTGFGRDLARLLPDQGWRAVVTARDAVCVLNLAAVSAKLRERLTAVESEQSIGIGADFPETE